MRPSAVVPLPVVVVDAGGDALLPAVEAALPEALAEDEPVDLVEAPLPLADLLDDAAAAPALEAAEAADFPIPDDLLTGFPSPIVSHKVNLAVWRIFLTLGLPVLPICELGVKCFSLCCEVVCQRLSCPGLGVRDIIADMKKFAASLVICFALGLSAGAQTLGESLDDVSQTAQSIAARQQGDSWGVRSAVDDLQRLAAQSARLSASLSTDDARQVVQLQRELGTAIRRVETTRSMLPQGEQSAIEQMLQEAEAVDSRLTGLRLRFGSLAASVPGHLADYPLQESDSGELGYRNVADLLIDVRCARRLVPTLNNGRRSQWGWGYGFNGGPNNLDALQVRRLELAARNLERELSTQMGDVRESVPAWERMRREYDRLGYPGAGSNVRQLDRVMNRLDEFYSKLD